MPSNEKERFWQWSINGVGGKVESNESIEEAAKREAKEEIGVSVNDITKAGEMMFTFPHKEDWNQLVHIYVTESWSGDIIESEEMNPLWFSVENIPYEKMWADDIYWLPQILLGNVVKGDIVFGEGDVVVSHEVTLVKSV